MQIADFLEFASEKILSESVAYARTIRAMKDDDEAVLRDHLPKILHAISIDLREAQSRAESIEKSKGLADDDAGTSATAAETHGLMRARSGLHIDQVVAEYRVLRSCVVRLWSEEVKPGPDSLRDVQRFNEAIDQALAESVRVYAVEVERWQQLFLGVLGHDLRGPLNAIVLTAEIIAMEVSDKLARATATLTRSARRMASLMDSLLQYNVASLNGGMTITRVPVDLTAACSEEIEIQRAGMPDADIRIASQGDTHGDFDPSRIREAVANLITNAVKHGLPNSPVSVDIRGDDDDVRVTVENAAAQDIPNNEIEQLFEPLRRGALHRTGSDGTNLGLGLFIVRQIVKVHGGEVTGQSSAKRVTFTIVLPKKAPAGSAAG